MVDVSRRRRRLWSGSYSSTVSSKSRSLPSKVVSCIRSSSEKPTLYVGPKLLALELLDASGSSSERSSPCLLRRADARASRSASRPALVDARAARASARSAPARESAPCARGARGRVASDPRVAAASRSGAQDARRSVARIAFGRASRRRVARRRCPRLPISHRALRVRPLVDVAYVVPTSGHTVLRWLAASKNAPPIFVRCAIRRPCATAVDVRRSRARRGARSMAAANEPASRKTRRRVICVVNQKGGVGKTTTAVNLAASVAAAERRTLLVDMDPQGNASSGVGVRPGTRRAQRLRRAHRRARRCARSSSTTEVPTLVVAPATQDLVAAEIELVDDPNRALQAARRARARSLDDRFDYVFIDCPPSLGLLTRERARRGRPRARAAAVRVLRARGAHAPDGDDRPREERHEPGPRGRGRSSSRCSTRETTSRTRSPTR